MYIVLVLAGCVFALYFQEDLRALDYNRSAGLCQLASLQLPIPSFFLAVGCSYANCRE